MQDNIYNLLFHTGLILTVHKELKLTTTKNNKNTNLIMGNHDSILGGNANQQHNEVSLL